jgi:hypothetical protein
MVVGGKADVASGGVVVVFRSTVLVVGGKADVALVEAWWLSSVPQWRWRRWQR